MGWFILKHIFSTILSIINITRLANQEIGLEILILRQHLSILQRKHTVMDPKNWTLPIGVEWRSRNEVQDAKEAKEL